MCADKTLGRSLYSLISERGANAASVSGQHQEGRVSLVAIEEIEGCSEIQPRRSINPDELANLADSIRANGVLQPILVQWDIDKRKYSIIAGERRWQAAKIAGLEKMPVILKKISKQKATEIAIIENLQRENLSSLEEAFAYSKFLDEYNCTQETLAAKIGKSRSYVANSLRLLEAPARVKELLREGKISSAHAKTILGQEDAEDLASRIANEKLSVRDTEAIVRQRANKAAIRSASSNAPNKMASGELLAMERLSEKIAQCLNVKTEILKKSNTVKIVLYPKDIAALDHLVSKLCDI